MDEYTLKWKLSEVLDLLYNRNCPPSNSVLRSTTIRLMGYYNSGKDPVSILSEARNKPSCDDEFQIAAAFVRVFFQGENTEAGKIQGNRSVKWGEIIAEYQRVFKKYNPFSEENSLQEAKLFLKVKDIIEELGGAEIAEQHLRQNRTFKKIGPSKQKEMLEYFFCLEN